MLWQGPWALDLSNIRSAEPAAAAAAARAGAGLAAA